MGSKIARDWRGIIKEGVIRIIIRQRWGRREGGDWRREEEKMGRVQGLTHSGGFGEIPDRAFEEIYRNDSECGHEDRGGRWGKLHLAWNNRKYIQDYGWILQILLR